MAFLHKYELYIGEPAAGKTILQDSYVFSSAVQEPFTDVDTTQQSRALPFDLSDGPQAGQFLLIDDVQMKADVKYSKKGKGKKVQPVQIEVYNTDPRIKKFARADNYVVLKAGWEDESDLPAIAVCQIIRVEEQLENGIDTKFTLYCGDSISTKKAVYLNKSWVKGTQILTVLTDMEKAFAYNGTPTGQSAVVVAKNKPSLYKTINKGLTVDGRLNEVFADFCDSLGLRYYTVLSRLYVVDKENKDDSIVSVLEVGTNNFRTSVAPMDDSTLDTKETTKTKTKGLKLEIFLNGRASTAQYVKITDGDYIGTYKINKVSHKLNYEGDDWTTMIECEG